MVAELVVVLVDRVVDATLVLREVLDDAVLNEMVLESAVLEAMASDDAVVGRNAVVDGMVADGAVVAAEEEVVNGDGDGLEGEVVDRAMFDDAISEDWAVDTVVSDRVVLGADVLDAVLPVRLSILRADVVVIEAGDVVVLIVPIMGPCRDEVSDVERLRTTGPRETTKLEDDKPVVLCGIGPNDRDKVEVDGAMVPTN